MKFNLSESLKQAEREYNLGGGDTFKFQEGDNLFRLMSETVAHQSTYKGRTSTKFACYVLDRKDGKIKLAFLPYTIIKAIEALQLDDDYAFDEVPMPYDITVKAKNAGTKEVEYNTIPRKKSPLTEVELQDLDAKKPIRRILEKIQSKQENVEEVSAEDHSMEITDDDIPA